MEARWHDQDAGERKTVTAGGSGKRKRLRRVYANQADARAAGLSVAHDDPYQGGYTTQQYGRPATGIHVVQVELARRLYMVERTLARGPGFDRTRAFCGGLVDVLAHAKP